MLRFPVLPGSRLTCGGGIARRFHHAPRRSYDFGMRCEQIVLPQPTNEVLLLRVDKGTIEIVSYACCILPKIIPHVRECSCFCDLLDIGIMSNFVKALERRQICHVCETDQ